MAAYTDKTFPKVELHLHLEGAIRPRTVWEIAQKRGVNVGVTSLEDLERELVGWETGDLATFLEEFTKFMPAVIGDREVIKRISYELCEDLANQGVVYFETRYSPQLFANSPGIERVFGGPEGDVTPRDVVRMVNEGIREGSRDFGIQGRTILCMLREKPEWSPQVLQLCKEFHNDTVVGIDLANNEAIDLYKEHIEAFKGAAEAGIHRTCHAGESGPASSVRTAVEVMGAERIGHGYHIIDDDSVLKLVKDKCIHLEVCPTSSTRTGALKPDFDKHCAKRFLREGLNISINTDDPTIFGTWMTKEFGIARNHFGMDDKALATMTLNSARACFLPQDEKMALVSELNNKFQGIM